MKDYRLQHLSGLSGIRVDWVGDILTRWQMFRLRLQKLLLDRHFKSLMPAWFIRTLEGVLSEQKRIQFWRRIATIILDRSFAADDTGVVAFDWISGNSVFPIEYVRTVVEMAGQRGLGTVSLPHGDSPHSNYLVRNDELSMAPREKFAPAKMFDRIVVPNELCASRFQPFVESSAIAVLGSARYCDEWLQILSQLLPVSPLEVDPEKLKLVMFLRKSDFSIFWEEVERVVQMLADFPRVELIIKAHTRGGWRQPLFKNKALKHMVNVRFVAGEVHSSHLLDWADAIIDIATSVSFEAVKLRKPVMAADYLHASVSTVAHYLPDCAWHCRDDAYRMTERLLKKGCSEFYDEVRRRKFIAEIIDVHGENVLAGYVNLLESLAAGEKTR